ncbi:hypothetical protein [Butyrivibrio sp. XPD2006]|uniref:hypothetical protein n=1 Tax=Butyrivibrio sp. XPD2006 TaxID=1280668 RepID=UPI0003B6531E|nr:hypothetical protein [Butyrivibrio sp. XPD2006]
MKAAKAFFITLFVVLLIGVVFLVGKNSIMKDVKATQQQTQSNEEKKSANPIKKAIVSEAIDTYAEKSSGKTKEIFDSMSEEDKDTVTEIIANNVSLDTVSEVQSYVNSEDASGLMEYAQENLSEEELKELEDIMSKYVTP